MCGIAGFQGEFDKDLLLRMSSLMSHRGPDDHGFWSDDKSQISLSHRRLSILDLSPLGHQPMISKDSNFVLSYNGEIYNYRELKVDLCKRGCSFKSTTDTEVIIYLYQEFGFDMLPMLNGIFSFALWDGREKRLLIARDGMGVKPLYFNLSNKGFIFASEMKSLILSGAVEPDISPGAVLNHLTFLWSPSPMTFCEGILKLEPGHALIVENGKITKNWKFYQIPYSLTYSVNKFDYAIEGTRYWLKKAVERQMVADVPVGAFLSGGLDSSSIVTFAREFTASGKLECFTIGFKGNTMAEEGFSDDLPYARKVAKHLGVELNIVDVDADFTEHLFKMIYHLDEPQADLAPINALLICELARKCGIKVLLSGAGGDDIFSGYRRHLSLKFERYWSFLPHPFKCLAAWFSNQLPQGISFFRKLSKLLRYTAKDSQDRLLSYFYWLDPIVGRSLAGPIIKDALNKFDEKKIFFDSLSSLSGFCSSLDAMLYLDSKFFLVDHNLNYTDKMSMATGVEVRVPFLDPDLVKFAANLAPEFKIRGAQTKWILKKSMEGYLPNDVIYRSKAGFGAPLRSWLKNPLKPMVDELLSERSLRARGLFDSINVRKLICDDRLGRIDASYSIFAMMCMEIWCRIFIDRTIVV